MRWSPTRSGAPWSGSLYMPDAGAQEHMTWKRPWASAWSGWPVPRADSAVARALGSAVLMERVSTYAELSKFGIVLLVLVSAAAGFMLRAPLGADFPWAHGLVVLVGVMLLSSGASAMNQVQERDRDALMARTAGRPWPSPRSPPWRERPCCGLASGIPRAPSASSPPPSTTACIRPGSSPPRPSLPCLGPSPAPSRR